MILALIIEDEVNSQNYLKQLVEEKFPEICILECAKSVEASVLAIESHKPDLVFLDVEIIGGTGFDILEKVNYKNFEVIFITAYNQFSLQALKKEAVDYILKPIDDEEFVVGVNKALNRINTKKEIEKSEKVNIVSLNNTHLINHHEILYLQADGVYTILFTKNGKITSTKNLGEYETVLGTIFFRCHHSFIVNLKFIAKVEKSRSGEITLVGGEKIPVSQRKISTLNKLLKHGNRG
jgi:two-component system LytT family response regulator